MRRVEQECPHLSSTEAEHPPRPWSGPAFGHLLLGVFQCALESLDVTSLGLADGLLQGARHGGFRPSRPRSVNTRRSGRRPRAGSSHPPAPRSSRRSCDEAACRRLRPARPRSRSSPAAAERPARSPGPRRQGPRPPREPCDRSPRPTGCLAGPLRRAPFPAGGRRCSGPRRSPPRRRPSTCSPRSGRRSCHAASFQPPSRGTRLTP